MSVQRSAGAIFWGLTLVTIGGLLLAHNLGYRIQIWRYVARYWPALLIGWGLLKFVDFFRFRRAGDRRPLFSGGEVALLILVIFAGSAITTAANVSPEIGNIFDIGDLDLWDITGNNFTYDQQQQVQHRVADGSEIAIVNLFGDVEVRPSESNELVVDVKKTIRASSREEADRLNGDFSFSILEEGSKYRITSNRDDGLGFRGTPRQRFKSSLAIAVPRHSVLHIDNRNGRVIVRDLKGNQTLVNRYGDVEARNLEGDLQIENRNGSVTVEGVSAGVVVNNRYSNTTVKDVGGTLEIHTRNGSVEVSAVKGDVTVDNSYAPISVDNVRGNLTITGRNNSVNAEHIDGDIRTDSSYQNVNIQDARGAVTVNSRNGDITLSFVKPPEKEITISARYGNVTLELPSASSFSINARTEYGDVYSEFDGVSTTNNRRDKALSGQVGQGGPQISVQLRNGGIHLDKRG